MRLSNLLASSALLLAASVYAYDVNTMMCLVNEQRQRYGLDNLGLDDRLDGAAQDHSDDQAYMGQMTHDGSDGSSPSDRVGAYGFNWVAVAENVAYGYADEQECMNNWMESAGHRDNILGDYTHFGSGVGYDSGGSPYYTQDFASDGSYGNNYPTCPGGGGNDYSGDGSQDNYSGNQVDYNGGGNNWYDGSNDSNNWYDGSNDSNNWYDGSSDNSGWYDGGNDWTDGGNDWSDGGNDWSDGSWDNSGWDNSGW